MMRIFEYAIIYHPAPKKGSDGPEKSELIIDVTTVLANSDKEAAMMAARAIPEKYVSNLERVEIAIRPF